MENPTRVASTLLVEVQKGDINSNSKALHMATKYPAEWTFFDMRIPSFL
jgi:hypothetical protein